MSEFKVYIENILNGLNLNKKQKSEMFYEFMDHLGLLKQEFMESGYSEEEAVKKATESFGDSVELKRKLAQLSKLRTLPNFLSGVVFVFITYMIGRHIWMIYPGTGWPRDFKIHLIWMVGGFIGILPFGYFIPLFFRKADHLLLISCISIISSIIEIKILTKGEGNWWGIYPAFTIGCILGGLSGLIILRAVNKVHWTIKNKIHLAK